MREDKIADYVSLTIQIYRVDDSDLDDEHARRWYELTSEERDEAARRINRIVLGQEEPWKSPN